MHLLAFSPGFLFLKGDNHPWHQIPGYGPFYVWQSFFILIGTYFFIKSSSISQKVKKVFILFLLLSIIPSAITIDAPHSTRSLNYFYGLTFLFSFGLVSILKKIKLKKYKKHLLVFLVLSLSSGLYLNKYFEYYKNRPPDSMLPWMHQTVEYINKSNYEKVVFDNPSSSPYLYILFYNKYDPVKYWNTVKAYKPNTIGLQNIEWFGRYLFIDNPRPEEDKNYLYVLTENKNFQGGKILKKITSPQGEVWATLIEK
jgi:hypothetical protein